jgi:3-hydroxyisobutyrate dehydrogenase-like beta-hydroxyacid dehydrogenase
MDAPVDASTPVAVAGIGNMGLPIAERVLHGGFPLAVFNRNAEKAAPLVERGAKLLASPADALREADICLTVLADDAAFESVVLGDDGILAGARPGTVLIDMSTVSVEVSDRVAGAASGAGVGYLRAPVSGNPTVVRGGTLTMIVSGPGDLAARVEPLLRAIGPTVLYVGDGERARVVKLVLQILIGGTAELLGEALVLGESAGVDREKLLEVIGASVVGSRFVDYKTEPLLHDDYSATFTTSLMLKDVGLVLDLAAEQEVVLPFAEQLSTLLESAVERGYGDQDFIALFRQLREAPTPEPTAIRDR